MKKKAERWIEYSLAHHGLSSYRVIVDNKVIFAQMDIGFIFFNVEVA